MLVWDVAGSHLELEVFADGRWEWFHSQDGAFQGDDGMGVVVPAQLSGVLARSVAR